MIGPDEFDDTFVEGGYDNSLWPGLAAALAAYLHTGSAKAMIHEYRALGRQNENLFAVYNAVECSDVNWPRNWTKWDADTRRVSRTAPFLAWDNAWFNAACAFWPVHGPARPLAIKGAGLPPVLMIQGSLDAATPYQGAQAAHGLLPREPRAVAVRASQPVREQLPQRLPGERRGAAGRRARQRHLPGAAGSLAKLLNRRADGRARASRHEAPEHAS
jgi:hypothetical protein